MLDDIAIEYDEDGARLVLTGDFVVEAENYCDTPSETTMKVRIPHDVLTKLNSELSYHRQHVAEGEAARREWEAHRRRSHDDGAYATDDPKSPGYHDRMVD